MNLKRHAKVVTADGQDVGKVKRLIIEPESKEVTHLVIHKGLVPSGEDDKVVPVSLIAWADDQQVNLSQTAHDFRALPAFEEKLNWEKGLVEMNGPRMTTTRPDIKLNIPDKTVVVSGVTWVLSADDQPMGKVEEVQTGSETDPTTYFVVTDGLWFKNRKLVPATWVGSIADDEIRLAVDAEAVNALKAY